MSNTKEDLLTTLRKELDYAKQIVENLPQWKKTIIDRAKKAEEYFKSKINERL